LQAGKMSYNQNKEPTILLKGINMLKQVNTEGE